MVVILGIACGDVPGNAFAESVLAEEPERGREFTFAQRSFFGGRQVLWRYRQAGATGLKNIELSVASRAWSRGLVSLF